MNISEIGEGIYYVGINDLHSQLFESMWTLPTGVTYNSYLIKGSDKIALIDTVPATETLKFLSNIRDIIEDAPIDYLIINHMEPDHSEAIEYIKLKYPGIKIIGNRTTAAMIKGFYNIDDVEIINDNQELDLGDGRKLKFILTPMLHWPETMMTYDSKTGTLFSGDAFGCFGSLNGGIFDKETDLETLVPEIYRYYAAIVAKYGNFVQKAIEKLRGTSINMICSTHGPVWTIYILHVIDLYDRLSKYQGQDGVVIAYGSMYGNTAEMAQLLARIFTLKGITVKIHNLSNENVSFALADAIRYKGIIIGSPTYNNEIFPPVKQFVDALLSRGFKNRVIGAFGSYAWTKGIGSKIITDLSPLKNITPVGTLDMKYSQLSDIEDSIEEYVDNTISGMKSLES